MDGRRGAEAMRLEDETLSEQAMVRFRDGGFPAGSQRHSVSISLSLSLRNPRAMIFFWRAENPFLPCRGNLRWVAARLEARPLQSRGQRCGEAALVWSPLGDGEQARIAALRLARVRLNAPSR